MDNTTIELLNSEGPILIAQDWSVHRKILLSLRIDGTRGNVRYDNLSVEKEVLVDFFRGEPLEFITKTIYWSAYSEGMKASSASIDRFLSRITSESI
jgi:uncharacterized protein (DUF2164 family)